MKMNCSEINQNLAKVVTAEKVFWRATSLGNAALALSAKAEILLLFEREFAVFLDLFEVRLRDQIAKSRGYYFVSAFSGDRAWAYKPVESGPVNELLILIDRKGKEIHQEILPSIPKTTKFYNGCAWAQTVSLDPIRREHWQLFDKDGEILATFPKIDPRGFEESGLVLIPADTATNLKYWFRFLGHDGKQKLTSLDCEYATPFCDGAAWLEYGDKLELVRADHNFAVVKTIMKGKEISGQYLRPTVFSGGISSMPDASGEGRIYYDRDGNEVFKSSSKIREFHEGRAIVGDDSYYFVDKTGKRVTKHFDRAESFHEGFATVMQIESAFIGSFGVRFYIDHNGKEYGCNLGHLMEAGDFSEGLAPVSVVTWQDDISIEKKYFINKKFKQAFPQDFDEIVEGFVDGVALVEKYGETFYINHEGEQVFG
ncbi:MAG: WG repeat-containing protein [Candidatus Berkelbacteria bacterium]|nr:WG repeat-containing protein [Candidatus Berkelbacteria bacterium]